MITALSGLLAAFGLLGAIAYLAHLRQIVGMLPLSMPLACASLLLLIAVVASFFGKQATTGALRKRGATWIVIAALVIGVLFGVAGALLQMAVNMAVAISMQVDKSEYQRVGDVSTRMLAPSFFVAFHGLMCFGLAYAGMKRISSAILVGGILLSVPTLYLLMSYGRFPL